MEEQPRFMVKKGSLEWFRKRKLVPYWKGEKDQRRDSVDDYVDLGEIANEQQGEISGE